MLPIHDDNPRHHGPPWVTYGLIAINALVFLYQLSLGAEGLERFFYEFAVVPQDLFESFEALRSGNVAPLAFAPLLTSMFMHGGWLHLGGNMLFLYIFGDNIEDRLGHLPYLAFYLGAGVVASLAHALSAPLSPVPSLGASGAIGGVLGAYVVMHPAARVTTLVILGFFITTLRLPAVLYLGVWFLMQSLQGLVALSAPSTAASGGTAWWAHIGGFLAGLPVGILGRVMPQRRAKRSKHADRWYSNR